MPQFDLANFLPQLVWLAFFFALLYGVVTLTLPRISRVMDDRETRVKDDLGSADSAKTQADTMQADYESGVARAQDDARAKLAEANAAAAKSLEAKLAASNAELSDRADVAAASLATARNKAMGEIEAVAADAAATIVEKLTGTRPAEAQATSAARAALA